MSKKTQIKQASFKKAISALIAHGYPEGENFTTVFVSRIAELATAIDADRQGLNENATTAIKDYVEKRIAAHEQEIENEKNALLAVKQSIGLTEQQFSEMVCSAIQEIQSSDSAKEKTTAVFKEYIVDSNNAEPSE